MLQNLAVGRAWCQASFTSARRDCIWVLVIRLCVLSAVRTDTFLDCRNSEPARAPCPADCRESFGWLVDMLEESGLGPAQKGG